MSREPRPHFAQCRAERPGGAAGRAVQRQVQGEGRLWLAGQGRHQAARRFAGIKACVELRAIHRQFQGGASWPVQPVQGERGVEPRGLVGQAAVQ